MTRFGKLAGALAVGCLAVGADLAAQDEKKPALKLEGGYTLVKGEKDGEPIPAERIKGAIIRFTKDEVIGTDKDKKEIFVAKYQLDTSAKPWKIMLKSTGPKEAKANGLIKKEGTRSWSFTPCRGRTTRPSSRPRKASTCSWLKNQKSKPGGDK
ncbi:MAG: TIGR03067 domain-containing protein [Gemmataceae bacterium]